MCVCVVHLPMFLCVFALCVQIVSVRICLRVSAHALVWGCAPAGRRVCMLLGIREHVCLSAGGGLGYGSPWPVWRVCMYLGASIGGDWSEAENG